MIWVRSPNSATATTTKPAPATLQKLPPDFAVSLVSFSDQPKVLVEPTTDHTQVADALSKLPRGQGTVIGDGLTGGEEIVTEGQLRLAPVARVSTGGRQAKTS